MGCGNCASGGCSIGCGRKGGCATGGCNKLNSHDWLGNMLSPHKSEVDNIYEVRFKNTRKAFYRNVHGLRLHIGDHVVVESDRGYDIGMLSLGGVLAELQLRKKKKQVKEEEMLRIFRKANETDVELLREAREREETTRIRTREIIGELNLDMKLTEVEFQGDNTKAIFYYIADHRVDFRELIKILAREFRIRVEMKQIGLRHEAGLVGGIGSCGRELCCSTWLTEFKTVSTSAARYQNLSLNPMKISGLCGRLKCCLNFELESYLDALQDFPKVEKLYTLKGTAFLQKTDIFKRQMWFSYADENTWYSLSVEEVNSIVKMNENGEKPEALSGATSVFIPDEELDSEVTKEDPVDFVDVVGQQVPEEPKRQNRSRNNNNKKKKYKGKRKPGSPQAKGGQTQEAKASQNSNSSSNSTNTSNKAPRSGGNSRQGSKGKKRPPRGPRKPRNQKPDQ